MGVLGLAPAALTELSPADILLAYRARVKYDELREKSAWERMRISAYYAIAPYLEKGKRTTPDKLYPLPWDAPAVPKKIKSKKDLTEAQRAWLARRNKIDLDGE